MTPIQYLQDGLEALGLSLTAAQQELLLAYCQLMQKWNKVYNLTRITQINAMIDKHLLDSLSILPFLSGEHFLDIGSGAGLPGIPIAISKPEWQVTCLDCVGKKTRFMVQAKAELKLSNLTIIHSRLEEYAPHQDFDMIISRAFQSVPATIEVCSHLNHHQLLLMKGQIPEAELNESDMNIKEIKQISVPHVNEARHAIIIERNPL